MGKPKFTPWAFSAKWVCNIWVQGCVGTDILEHGEAGPRAKLIA